MIEGAWALTSVKSGLRKYITCRSLNDAEAVKTILRLLSWPLGLSFSFFHVSQHQAVQQIMSDTSPCVMVYALNSNINAFLRCVDAIGEVK